MANAHVWVPHADVNHPKWKHVITKTCFYTLRHLSFQKDFVHCNNHNTPMVAGKGCTLLFFADYAWNGMSAGFNTYNTRRGTLVHDALYQAIRIGVLASSDRGGADDEMALILKEDRMLWIRRKWIRFFLRIGGSVGSNEPYKPCVPIPNPVPPQDALELRPRPR